MRIAVLITCHNRKELTLAALRALLAQEGVRAGAGGGKKSEPRSEDGDRWVELFLTDDGSTDGTSEAVRELWPQATVIAGSGHLYWCGGMRLAWAEAAKTDPDYYLLVNDDTVMNADAVVSLLEIVGSPQSRRIAVAPIQDPQSGEWVYGGVRGRRFAPVQPCGEVDVCDTLNTNCALIPRGVYQALGGFADCFTHSMGDYDYGFRATRSGVQILQAGRFLGQCKGNPVAGTWRDRALPRARRWELIHGPKGLPPKEWLFFCRRNLGFLWFVRFLSPYVRVLLGV
jgi:GT2 family glycosyltransferase